MARKKITEDIEVAGNEKASGSWFSAVLRGRLLLRLKVDKYLPQIIFFFLCAVGYIAISLGIENVLHQREENVKTLNKLNSIHVETSCELTSLYSVCQVEDLLSEMGSDLKLPADKATTLK